MTRKQATCIGLGLLAAAVYVLTVIAVACLCGCAAPNDAILLDVTHKLGSPPISPTAVESSDLPAGWGWCVWITERKHGLGVFHVKHGDSSVILQVGRWDNEDHKLWLSPVQAQKLRQAAERGLRARPDPRLLADGEAWYLGCDMDLPHRAELLAEPGEPKR